MRRKIIPAILLSATSLILLLTLWFFPALHFLLGFRERLSSAGRLSAVSQSPKREIKISEAGLSAHVYRPVGAKNILLVIPGLHPDGPEDPRFAAFAESLAAAGFIVVAPDIPDFRDLKVSQESVDQLTRLILALPRYLPSSDNTGLLGISYGAGPALMALARPEVKDKIRYFVGVGGYYDLDHVVEFSFSGLPPQGKTGPRAVHPWGRLIFALHHLPEFVDPSNAAILRASLPLRLDLREKEAEEKERDLSPAGREFLKELLGDLSPPLVERFRQIFKSQRSKEELPSPKDVIRNIDPAVRIYLLHGESDEIIPFEETLALARALKETGHPVQVLIIKSLIHVDFVLRATNLWDIGRLLWWTRGLLTEK